MKKTILTLLTLNFIFIIALTTYVSAAGIASPYWEDYPLNMYSGETKTIEFTLQNMVGNEDITVKASITEGSAIASLEQDTFTAKAGTEDTKIPVKITIPKDYPKTMQRVKLSVKTLTSGEGGMVKLGLGWSTAFNVIISEKPVSRQSLIAIIIGIMIIAIILVLIILVLLLKRKR